jgi:hypothetical protein
MQKSELIKKLSLLRCDMHGAALCMMAYAEDRQDSDLLRQHALELLCTEVLVRDWALNIDKIKTDD